MTATLLEHTKTARQFGEHVRELRERKRWPVDTLAARSFLTVQRVRAMEAGRGEPTLRELVKVARAFGMRPSILISPFNETKRKTKSSKRARP